MQINGFAFSLLFFSDCGHAQVDYPSRVTHPGEGGGYFFEFVVGTFSIDARWELVSGWAVFLQV
jgi:hypothetical protein